MRETLLQRLILLQAGTAAAARERVQMTVNTLVELGRLEREEAGGTHRAEGIFSGIQSFSNGTQSFFDTSFQQSLHSAGLPNRQDFENIAYRIEQAEQRLRRLENASGDVPEKTDGSNPHKEETAKESGDSGA